MSSSFAVIVVNICMYVCTYGNVGGLAILESVLWDAVPSYLRKLNKQCILSLGKVCMCEWMDGHIRVLSTTAILCQALPLDHVPIQFSSWMGENSFFKSILTGIPMLIMHYLLCRW